MRVIYQSEFFLWKEIDIFKLLTQDTQVYNMSDLSSLLNNAAQIWTLKIALLSSKNYNHRFCFKSSYIDKPQVLIYIYWHVGVPIKIVIWAGAAFSQRDIETRTYVNDAEESVLKESTVVKNERIEREFRKDLVKHDKIPTPMKYKPDAADKVSMVMLSVHGEEQVALMTQLFEQLIEGLSVEHETVLYLTNNANQREFYFSFDSCSIVNEEKRECTTKHCETCALIALDITISKTFGVPI